MDKVTSNNILATFDMAIDIDLGLFSILKERYNNPEFVITSYLRMPIKILISQLVERIKINPLYLVLKSKYQNNADQLYSQFMRDEYKSILDNSRVTNIFQLLKMYADTGIIRVNILCKNKYEEQIINKYKEKYKANINIILYNELEKFDSKPYDSIYIKQYRDCLIFKEDTLEGKKIYVANYKFNRELDDDSLGKVIKIIDVNEISLIDIYSIDQNLINSIKG